MLIVQGTNVDISKKVISNVYFWDEFETTMEMLKFDYFMTDLKKVKQLSLQDKLMYYIWLAGYIGEAKEEAK